MSPVLKYFVRLRFFWLALLLILLVACSANAPASSQSSVQQPAPTVSPVITGPTVSGLLNCQPASPIDNAGVGPEVHGTATNAELWALLESTSGIPPTAKSEVKIVWRM